MHKLGNNKWETITQKLIQFILPPPTMQIIGCLFLGHLTVVHPSTLLCLTQYLYSLLIRQISVKLDTITYSSCQWKLLKRFLMSKVKVICVPVCEWYKWPRHTCQRFVIAADLLWICAMLNSKSNWILMIFDLDLLDFDLLPWELFLYFSDKKMSKLWK